MDMIQISFDGIKVGELNFPASEVTVPKENADRIKTLVSQVYDAATALNTSLIATVELQAKYDAQEEEMKVLKEKITQMDSIGPEKIKEAVETRLHLEKTAAFFKVDKVDEMDNMQLMVACIGKKHGEDTVKKLDSESEQGQVYIRARYDILAEEAEKGATGLDQLHALHTMTAPRTDNLEDFTKNKSKDGKQPATRESFLEQSRNAFRDPQGKQKGAV